MPDYSMQAAVFGIALLDYDDDGWLDLLVTNELSRTSSIATIITAPSMTLPCRLEWPTAMRALPGRAWVWIMETMRTPAILVW